MWALPCAVRTAAADADSHDGAGADAAPLCAALYAAGAAMTARKKSKWKTMNFATSCRMGARSFCSARARFSQLFLR